MSVIREWKDLRDQIRFFRKVAEQKDKELSMALYKYRVLLSRLAVKPRLDNKVWIKFDELTTEFSILIKVPPGFPLMSTRSIRGVHQAWSDLLKGQNELLELLSKATKGADFYNRMVIAKARKKKEVILQDEILNNITQAKRALIRAIYYVAIRERAEEPITLDSHLLDMGSVIKMWEVMLQEITKLEVDPSTDPEDLIQAISQLRELIIETPRQAEIISQVENEVHGLLSRNQDLRPYGRNGISEDELNEVLKILQDEIPTLWARAEWATLEEKLAEVAKFIRKNDAQVNSELFVLGKRAQKNGFPKVSSPSSHEFSGYTTDSLESKEID